MKRPNPAQWLWYAAGGRLPGRLSAWVLHDVTARTWVLRHAARSIALLTPIAAACLLFPGPLGLRLAMALLVIIVGAYFSLSYVEESCELRAVKHGHAPEMAKRIRDARTEVAEAAAQARYNATYR